MSATKAIVGAVALGLTFTAGAAGAVPHAQFIRVGFAGHEAVARAAEHVHLDRPVVSKHTDGKKCSHACRDRNQKIPKRF